MTEVETRSNEAIRATLRSQGREIQEIKAEIGGLRGMIVALGDKISTGQRTPWNVIIGIAALVLTIGGLSLTVITGFFGVVAWQYDANQARIEANVVKMREARVSAARAEGGAIAHRQITDDRVVHLDATLQHEMLILDSRIGSQVENIDRRLQQEMRLLNVPLVTRLDRIEKQMDKVSATRWDAQMQGRFEERLDRRWDEERERLHVIERRLNEIRERK